MTPQELCHAILQDCEPASLLVSGKHASAAGRHWQQDHPECVFRELPAETRLLEEEYAAPHDMALLEGVLDQCEEDAGSLLLGQLRNYGNHQIAAIIRNDSPLTFHDFIALGFVRQTTIEPAPDHPGYTLYTYNIDSYNHKRTWNNPRYWANPQMWGKAWW